MGKEEEYKGKVLNSFRVIFPQAKLVSQNKDQWVEFCHNGLAYGVRCPEGKLWFALNGGFPPESFAAELLRESVSHIVLGDKK